MLATQHRSLRQGLVVVWIALLLPVLVGMVAFAVDLSFICLVNNQLQVAADAGAMAGAGALTISTDEARAKAKEFVLKNPAAGEKAETTNADISLGTWDLYSKTFTPGENGAKAVRVTARKKVNLFFAPIFGMKDVDLHATAIATINPRDIAFVVDLSGSMNNDTEIWATNPINSSFPSTPTVGSDLMQALFTDLGFGNYPGTTQYIGQVSGFSSNRYTPNASGKSPIFNYLTNTYLVNNNGVAAKYRIANNDSSATKRQKAYRWLIDYQLAPLMPNAKPTPNSDTALDYYTDYLDYMLDSSTTVPGQNSRRNSGGANPYNDSWPNLTAAVNAPFNNKVGYLTYVQFMLDYGSNVKVAGNNTNVMLSRHHPNCPWRLDNDPTSPGYGLYFPPREQPTHAARLAIMAGIKKVAQFNATVPESFRDHICVITFDTSSGTEIRYPLTKDSIDYEAARASVRDLQAVSDWEYSTASENGLVTARNHLDPTQNPAGARPYAEKILIFLSDGIPNIKKSSDSAINLFMNNHPDGEWFNAGSFNRERNAVLMQILQMQSLGWKTHSVGIGLGTDLTLMDRMARMAGTGVADPANPNGPKISRFASGNPADYQARLTAIFEEITATPSVHLVK